MGKYGNRKTVADGMVFDSQKEARRCCELKLLEKAGVISGLQRQFPIKLLPVQRNEKGKVIERAVTYVADFIYNENGQTVVEDVKGGVRTKEYILKRKMCLYFHGIRIREV